MGGGLLGITALCWHSRCWFGSTVEALFVPPSFPSSTEMAEQHRLKGSAEIKERMLSPFHIFFFWFSEQHLCFQKTHSCFQGLFFSSTDKSQTGHHSKNVKIPKSNLFSTSSFIQPGDPVLRRQSLRGLLSPYERSSPLQLSWPQERRCLHQCDGAEVVRLGHLPV